MKKKTLRLINERLAVENARLRDDLEINLGWREDESLSQKEWYVQSVGEDRVYVSETPPHILKLDHYPEAASLKPGDLIRVCIDKVYTSGYELAMDFKGK